jgi:hypothetical protein
LFWFPLLAGGWGGCGGAAPSGAAAAVLSCLARGVSRPPPPIPRLLACTCASACTARGLDHSTIRRLGVLPGVHPFGCPFAAWLSGPPPGCAPQAAGLPAARRRRRPGDPGAAVRPRRPLRRQRAVLRQRRVWWVLRRRPTFHRRLTVACSGLPLPAWLCGRCTGTAGGCGSAAWRPIPLRAEA